MPRQSAGLLMFRRTSPQVEVFLVHPGGPFWAKKDLGAWSIPKGEFAPSESALAAAMREFNEETGFTIAHQSVALIDLGTIKQAGGKLVAAWAFERDCNPADLVSNLYRMEWPPRSGRFQEFAEVDRGAWFSLAEAGQRILKSQQPFLASLAAALCA